MNEYAPAKRISSFHPPQRTLMGPGPTEIHPRVLTTMSQPAIGYLDPVFVEMMEELKALLRYVYQTKNPLTFPISGPGSVGMEYCFVNLVAPGDKVIVCQNGVFGGRMIENVVRCGGTPILVEDKWGEPIDPNKLDVRLEVGGQIRQQANTKDMLVDVAGIVAYTSSVMRLDPGDVILTGAPPGVGEVHAGEVMISEISEIGTMRNPVREVR